MRRPYQLKLSYLLSALVIALALVASMPVDAQDAAPVECDVDEVQGWYDAIDGQELYDLFLVAFDTDARASVQAQAAGDLLEITDALAEDDFPACIEEVHEIYIHGLRTVILSMEDMMDSDVVSFALNFGRAMQDIGEFRGWMKAIGVETDPETRAFYFK